MAEDGEQGWYDLSPEDTAAWVDSCLAVDDPNIGEDGNSRFRSDDAWATLTEGFISALASFSSPQDDEGSTAANPPGGELISKIVSAASLLPNPFPERQFLGVAEDDYSREIAGESGPVVIGKEFPQEQDRWDADDDDDDAFSFALSGEEGDEAGLVEDLFKVWDLRIAGEAEEEEEDELLSLLKKGLDEPDPALEDLVLAINDLSLSNAD